MEERIQKILSRAGFGSRRACEQLIAEGRVMVNGRLAQLGDKAESGLDRIEVNGRNIPAFEPLRYIALYKPRYVISAVTSPDRRKTVRDLVEEPGTLFPVGRLDVDSEGLILLTNDGELTNRLTHPSFKHEKEYRILVASRPDKKQLTAWRNGVVLDDDYKTKPIKVRVTGTYGKGAWMQVILTEGRKRQIREMGRLTGLPVVRIIRVRIGSLQLGHLKPKQWRHLTPEEVVELKGEAPSSQLKKSKLPTKRLP